MRRARVRWWDI